MTAIDPVFSGDPPQPRPPAGVVIEEIPSDSADYLDGLDGIARQRARTART